MRAFTISGNRWFDQMGEPVLLLGEDGIDYYNGAAERLFQLSGWPLKEGGGLPEALTPLNLTGDAAGEVEAAGRRWLALARQVEAGRLIQLRPVAEDAVFPNQRLPQLAERVRGPMSNLLSAAELLTRELPEERTPRMERYLSVLNQSYYRLLRLLNHLDYARYLSGEEKEVFEPVVLDLAGLFREVGRQVASLGCPGFTCQDNAVGLLVEGDSDLLAHLMYQLVANAWHSGGSVAMQLDHMGSRAVLSVSDNGRGMSESALRDAFDPTAGRAGLSAASDGLGLGIPICQHITALHGGTMVLENRREEGTTAIVSLPVCSMAQNVEVHTSRRNYDPNGGFSPALIELSEVAPLEFYRPEHLD